MNESQNDHKVKKKGTIPNQGSLQAYLQNFTKEAIDGIVEILRTTRNENLRMGAAKIIIDKSIPDIKALEISGTDGRPIEIIIVEDVNNNNEIPTSNQELSKTTIDIHPPSAI